MSKEKRRGVLRQLLLLPNLLSIFRVALIPVIIWLYCFRHDYYGTAYVLLLSGVTDVADGFIARRWGLVSDVGKAIDPVADKLTQIATLVCLLTRFPHMLLPLALLVIKELVSGVMSLQAIRRTGEVHSADWHGKVATALIYAMMLLHILWADITPLWSDISIGVCIVMMVISFILYAVRHMRMIRSKGK